MSFSTGRMLEIDFHFDLDPVFEDPQNEMEQVTNGMAWFDKICPWVFEDLAAAIRSGQFEMESTCSCALGTAFQNVFILDPEADGEDHGWNLVWIWSDHYFWHQGKPIQSGIWNSRHGFMTYDLMPLWRNETTPWKTLQTEWERQIAERVL